MLIKQIKGKVKYHNFKFNTFQVQSFQFKRLVSYKIIQIEDKDREGEPKKIDIRVKKFKVK